MAPSTRSSRSSARIELFRPSGAETVDRQPSNNDHWAFCWVPPLHHFQQGRQPGDATYNEEMARDSAFSNPRACAGWPRLSESTWDGHLADLGWCRWVAQARPRAETSAAAASASTGDETAPTDANTAAPEDWYYDTLRRRQDEHWASERLRVGVRHARDGQMAEAMRCYEHALRLCPSHGPAAERPSRAVPHTRTRPLVTPCANSSVRSSSIRATETRASTSTRRSGGSACAHTPRRGAGRAGATHRRAARRTSAPTLCSAAIVRRVSNAARRRAAVGAEGPVRRCRPLLRHVSPQRALWKRSRWRARLSSARHDRPAAVGGGHHGTQASATLREARPRVRYLRVRLVRKASARGKRGKSTVRKRRNGGRRTRRRRRNGRKRGKEESASSSEGRRMRQEEGESRPILAADGARLWGF